MKRIIIVLTLIILISCTDAKKAKFGGFNQKFKIELLSCSGEVVRTWISTGKVSSEENTDGYYFMDTKTNKLIEVTGNLIITEYQE